MFFTVLLLFLCFFFTILHFKPQRPKNFPPGPPPLPILGNLLQLNKDNPLKDLDRLKRTYGDVYSLFIGPRPAVVINGFKAIKEAMVIKAADFAGRPQDMFLNDLSKEQAGVILEDYNHHWKEHRRFGLKMLKTFGLGKSQMEDTIYVEIQHTIDALEKSIGKTLSPDHMFHNVASNVICQIIFGTRYEYDNKLIRIIIETFAELGRVANGPWCVLYDSVPMFRKIMLPIRKAFKTSEACKDVVTCVVAEHKKRRVPGEPRHLIDCYLDELQKTKGEDPSFSEKHLVPYIIDLHFAATDTTSNTLLTGFLYLMTYPHIQEQCQQEIDQVLEGKDRASFGDRINMPYTQAVIHEVLRITKTVPLSVYHYTTKDTELMGYSIPKGTLIIENLASVMNEEGQWKFPHEFNPKNFLNDQGALVQPEAFIPFSAGPRKCLGEGLARMELFLIMVTLLRKFKFIWPEDAGEPDYIPQFGISMTPKPFRMKVELRLTK
ncbi:cytochrome P450 2D14-like [Parambassis ranga]|uniref:Cytochrome P450 2D14-like n=1 Tax=Parambassis ranga TaxID=210632 RepID=A0A6P7IGB2_9TELE|nr:cytochrome P450 2D14-like [Parambassis ranga]